MPPSIITEHSSHQLSTTPPPSTSKRGRDKGRRSSSKNHRSNSNTSCRTIYCPRTETTYEGEVMFNYSTPMGGLTVPLKSNSPSSVSPTTVTATTTTTTNATTTTTNATTNATTNNPLPLFIKHGKGTIHNHRDNTTLVGFFQHDQIIGHAIQTFYDHNGKCAIAQYEGSFTIEGGVNNNNNNNYNHHYCEEKKCYNEDDKEYNNIVSSSLSSSSYTSNNTFLRHGFGKYSWPLTGDEYVGEFHCGVFQGKGTFTWGSTGDRYEGLWYKGRMHGEDGKKTTASGDEFIGTFVKGRATGYGIKHFACGDVHDGMYRKDKRHGFGSYKWNDGDQYVGQWQHGRMFGRGVKCLVYKPEKGNSIRHRINEEHGMQRGDLNEVFYGTLVNDKAQGYGLKYYACGDTYCGQYENDMRHNYGVYTWSSGETYSGNWWNGRMCGIGMKTLLNGDVYDGEFLNNEAHGFGVKTFISTGDMHYGEYQYNLRHGKGLYRWLNGDEYEGNYEKGEQSGYGCFRWNNGLMTFTGYWHKGQKHGPGFLRVLSPDQSDEDNKMPPREHIFFEVWSKGTRVIQLFLNCTWDNIPLLDDIPEYHATKHTWEDSQEINLSSTVASRDDSSIPMLEDGNATLEPIADDTHLSNFQSQASDLSVNVYERALTPMRHYSIDFYSSPTSEETKSLSKPRSCSFSSFISSSSVLSQSQKHKGQPRCSIRKVHYCKGKGGFVIIAGKKKIRISKF